MNDDETPRAKPIPAHLGHVPTVVAERAMQFDTETMERAVQDLTHYGDATFARPLAATIAAAAVMLRGGGITEAVELAVSAGTFAKLQTEFQLAEGDGDPEGEAKVLRTALADAETLEAVPFLRPGHFRSPANQVVFQTILQMKERGQLIIDVVSVAQHLKDHGLLELAGGTRHLADLVEGQPTPASMELDGLALVLHATGKRERQRYMWIRTCNGLVRVFPLPEPPRGV